MFKVQIKQCNQCLFSANKIVSNERKRELIRNCVNMDSFFVCHKQQTVGGKQDFGLGLCCRGFFDRFKTKPIAMAKFLKVIEFVKVGCDE